jgi:hypothetical protein
MSTPGSCRRTQQRFVQDAQKDHGTIALRKANPVCRAGDHPSDKDSRDHFTGVCIDSNGDGKTVHFPTK